MLDKLISSLGKLALTMGAFLGLGWALARQREKNAVLERELEDAMNSIETTREANKVEQEISKSSADSIKQRGAYWVQDDDA